LVPGAIVEGGAVIGPRGCCTAARSSAQRRSEEHRAARERTVQAGCIVGKRCILHAGSVVGADGLGSRSMTAVPEHSEDSSGPHRPVGGRRRARGDGASTATLGRRRGRGTKIDNLVQVGHNVKVGRCRFFARQVGISGSAQLARSGLGGQAGVGNHIVMGDGSATRRRQAGVAQDVAAGVTWRLPRVRESRMEAGSIALPAPARLLKECGRRNVSRPRDEKEKENAP